MALPLPSLPRPLPLRRGGLWGGQTRGPGVCGRCSAMARKRKASIPAATASKKRPGGPRDEVKKEKEEEEEEEEGGCERAGGHRQDLGLGWLRGGTGAVVWGWRGEKLLG